MTRQRQDPLYTGRADLAVPVIKSGAPITAKQVPKIRQGGTVSVDQYEPNPWGIYQVHGNVGEWVEDCWTASVASSSSSPAAVSQPNCESHVLRGGSWRYGGNALRAASREGFLPAERANDTGFRIVRDVETP